MMIQQMASPSGKSSIAATLFNETERGGGAGSTKFASTLRDSIDESAERGPSRDEEMQTAPVKKRVHEKDESREENPADGPGQNNQAAPPASARSGDTAKAGPAEGTHVKPEQTTESGQGTDTHAEPLALAGLLDPASTQQGMPGNGAETASLLAQDMPYLTGFLRGITGMPHGTGGSASFQNKLTGTGNGLPAGGKELPPGLQLSMETGINSPFDLDGTADLDISSMPGFSENSLLTDIPLLKTGTEQSSQNTAPNLQGLSLSALSALTAPRDGRSANAETSATTNNLQLYSNAELGSDAWLDDFGTKIQWLQNMKHSRADLTLHPAELGSIEIRIVTEDNNTKVTIVTQTGAARDIIEGTLPRLREMLASQGMELEQGSVSQQTAEDRRQQQSNDRDNGRQDSEDMLTEVSARQQTRLLAAGQIDHYV